MWRTHHQLGFLLFCHFFYEFALSSVCFFCLSLSLILGLLSSKCWWVSWNVYTLYVCMYVSVAKVNPWALNKTSELYFLMNLFIYLFIYLLFFIPWGQVAKWRASLEAWGLKPQCQVCHSPGNKRSRRRRFASIYK